MPWAVVDLIGLPRPHAERVSARLFALGAAGLQEDWLPGETPPPRQPWDTGPRAPLPHRIVLRAWFEDPDRPGVAAALADVGVELVWGDVEDVDWEARWRAGFEPFVVSERLVVAPPWDAPEGALIIEPGQGFGSGAHPTTRQALLAVDALADGLHDALDVGSGSGILALAAEKLGMSATGIDVEDSAVTDARANAARNGLSATFSTTPLDRVQAPADLVLANLHAELVVHLAEDLIRLTRRWLVLAGILADREDLVRRRLDPHLRLAFRDQDGEWVSLRYEVRA